MTVDEELSLLEDSLRRLKVEYDMYFGGGSKRPPTDLEWKVQAQLKRFSDSQRLTFPQRFRYNTMAQRYALYSDLWRQKLKIKEEGYRRPQDALLAISGVRIAPGELKQPSVFIMGAGDAESAKVESLYRAMVEARKQSGGPPPGTLDSFRTFLKRKTEQLRTEQGAAAVEYSLVVEDGQPRLKVRPKK